MLTYHFHSWIISIQSSVGNRLICRRHRHVTPRACNINMFKWSALVIFIVFSHGFSLTNGLLSANKKAALNIIAHFNRKWHNKIQFGPKRVHLTLKGAHISNNHIVIACVVSTCGFHCKWIIQTQPAMKKQSPLPPTSASDCYRLHKHNYWYRDNHFNSYQCGQSK